MKKMHLVAVLVAAMSASTVSMRPTDAASRAPAFQAESIQDFNSALRRDPHRGSSSVHHDYAGYRAFRFLNLDMVLVGVASNIYLDAAGRLHVVQAHGEPMGGHVNTSHEEYSHVLIPPGVVLPR